MFIAKMPALNTMQDARQRNVDVIEILDRIKWTGWTGWTDGRDERMDADAADAACGRARAHARSCVYIFYIFFSEIKRWKNLKKLCEHVAVCSYSRRSPGADAVHFQFVTVCLFVLSYILSFCWLSLAFPLRGCFAL